MTDSLVVQILNAPKTSADFSGDMADALNFGFSYVESEDHMVAYVLASPSTVLDILRTVEESMLNPDQEIVGDLWTAKLLCSKKVPDSRIIFVNDFLSTALLLDLLAKHKE